MLSLIEAVVLHERLYTLPCKPSQDLTDLTLRNELISNGILHELSTKDDHEEIAKLICSSLLSFEKRDDRLDTMDERRADESKKTLIQNFLGLSESQPLGETLRHKKLPYNVLGVFGSDDEIALSSPNSRNIVDLGHSLVADVENMGSGDYNDDGVLPMTMREMYYIICSERYYLPYWPQLTRLRFSKTFPNYFTKDFRTKLYRRVAEALKSTVTEIFDDVDSQMAFVPPFATMVLERSTTPSSIVPSLLDIRHKYRGIRRRLSEIELERRSNSSIRTRKRLREKERLLLDGAAKSFERPSTIQLEGIVRYVPELVKPVVAPHDPTNYSADLLLKPLHWVGDWWRMRPVQPIFDLAAKIEQVRDYSNLIDKVFGNRFYYASPWEDILIRDF